MSFLDFIRNRQAQQQQSASQPKPETAKEMYSREAAQDRASARPVDQIPHSQQEKVDGIKADLQQAMRGANADAPQSAPVVAEGATGPQPMAQMSMNQDKAAPALSPTSAQAGTRLSEQDAPAQSQESPSAKTRERSQERQQTMARRPPSWER